MAILPGRRLGPYEILSAIGAGGMGEVYKARDTRLDRIVAIKILPTHLADRVELRERFEREAKTIASLNHPHICTLYDTGHQDDIDFLVMEYIEGETLAQRLAKGALPIQQVMQYAIEIADALDKAHRKGITHRDLKPGNIMLTKSGAKLLDFGLAKLKQDVAPSTPESQLVTMKGGVTGEGTILGTLQYMAPEQVEAKEVDARTDSFAFGAVVYEMATGKKAFEGKTSASVMAKILESEPPSMASLQPMTPAALDRLVKKCLEKDPDKRWQSASDVCDELKWIAESGSQAGSQPAVVSVRGLVRRTLIGIAGVLFVIAAIAAFAIRYLKPDPSAAPKTVTRFNIIPPPGLRVANQDVGNLAPSVAISPDGTHIVFAAGIINSEKLYVRSLDSLETRPIPETEGGTRPFFSPDGQWLGFTSGAELKKVPLNGGAAVTLGTVQMGGGASWTSQGTILFGENFGALQQISDRGGDPHQVFPLEKDEAGAMSATLLPGGNEVLFAANGGSGTGGEKISVRSITAGERRDLIPAGGSLPRYVPPGYLVYAQAGNLMAAPFDVRRLAVTGPPVTMVEGVLQLQSAGVVHFDVSASGTLVYIPSSTHALLKLVWVDRKGTEQAVNAPPHTYVLPRISSDGRRVAAGLEETDPQIWIYDLSRDALTRLTFKGKFNVDPIWTPDGRRIVYKGAGNRLFWQVADGSAEAEEITTSPLGTNNVPGSWSPDGQNMVFTFDVSGGRQIWIFSAKDRKIHPFEEQPPRYETAPRFSPDGRWIAYTSSESDRNEVYVRAFPGPGGKWQISTDGGSEPVWNPKGRELFYRNGKKMMAVDYEGQQTFSASKPKLLFEGPYVPTPRTFPDYDVSPDGQRFLMLKPAEEEQSVSQIIVVQNWVEELKQKVPTGKN